MKLDDRTISFIKWPNDKVTKVGELGVTKIEVEYETGTGMPWFTVWCGWKLGSRHNAALILVVAYADEQEKLTAP